MKPTISVYTKDSLRETKRFEDFIFAAFWIGVDYAERDLKAIKIDVFDSQEVESLPDLRKFADLLLAQQIDFSIKFLGESNAATEHGEEESGEPEGPAEEASGEAEESAAGRPEVEPGAQSQPSMEEEEAAELERLKDEFNRGVLTKRQYESRRDALLKRWRQRVDEGLSK